LKIMNTTAPVKPGRRASRLGRPRGDDAQRIAPHVLDVAWRIFVDSGYGGVTIEAISREARVNKRTIYSRFAGKEALFEAAVARAVDRMRYRTDATVVAAPKGKWLKVLVGQILRTMMRREVAALTAFMHGEGASLPYIRNIAASAIETSVLFIVQLAGEHGKPASAAEYAVLARCLLDMLGGHVTTFYFANADTLDVEAHLQIWEPRLIRVAHKIFDG
jgi:AcrR family transcriptional regulator